MRGKWRCSSNDRKRAEACVTVGEMKLSLAVGRLHCRPPPMMEPIDSIEKNDPLGPALKQWKVDAALPPQFGDEVWRRIERAEGKREPSLWREWFHIVEAAFRRPALAISYVIILFLAGLSIGFTQARQDSARMDEALGSRYVHSVDPYQTPRH